MDAVEFVKEYLRMCAQPWDCMDCPAYKTDFCTAPTKERSQEGAEEVVQVVEEWSAAHPRKTRQSVFNEQELLKKWQKRLGLQDWTIKLCVECKPEEMAVQEATGCTEWSEAIKTAKIEILDPLYYGDRIIPFDFEKTLVHELLHLKMSFWCQDTDDVEDRVMHQIIDDLARAFTVKDGDN